MAHSCKLGLSKTPSDTIGIRSHPFSLDGYLTLTLYLSDTGYFVVDIVNVSTTHVESQYLVHVPMLIIDS